MVQPPQKLYLISFMILLSKGRNSIPIWTGRGCLSTSIHRYQDWLNGSGHVWSFKHEPSNAWWPMSWRWHFTLNLPKIIGTLLGNYEELLSVAATQVWKCSKQGKRYLCLLWRQVHCLFTNPWYLYTMTSWTTIQNH